MSTYQAEAEVVKRELTAGLCRGVLQSVTAWCACDARRPDLSVDVAGTDANDMSKRGEFSSSREAVRFAQRLVALRSVVVHCRGGQRKVTVYLYGPAESGYSSKILAASPSEVDSEGFLKQVVSRIDDLSAPADGLVPSGGLPEVTRKARLPAARLTPENLGQLCLLLKTLLGYDILPTSCTFSVRGRDRSRREVTVSPTTFSSTGSAITQLSRIHEVSLSTYGNHRLSLRVEPGGLIPSTAQATSSETTWADNAVQVVLAWAKASRPHGARGALYWLHRVLVVFAPVVVSGIAGVAFVVFVLTAHSPEIPALQSSRLHELQDARNSLERSIRYIDQLSGDIHSREAALEAIKREHKQWEPLVRTDQKAIDRIALILERNSERRRTVDMVLSFLVGVASSLAGSWLFVLRRRREASAQVLPLLPADGKPRSGSTT
ncbi:MAG: hypothetical protein NTU88_12425, partial [Armatimonadetes bacterium]|nr:hypothetical protein [Armatimonadota bacterium]